MDRQKNPYVLVPGEKLTLHQLFNRFLNWKIWNSLTNRGERYENCDPELHNSFLCCLEHFEYTHESADFKSYFLHLTWEHIDGFSIQSMCFFINNHELTVDEKIIADYFGITVQEWVAARRTVEAQNQKKN